MSVTDEIFEMRLRAAREALFCEHILCKSSSNILLTTLEHGNSIEEWTHFPVDDVFDPDTGSTWYYHCHTPRSDDGEHGHFHCFVRPDGRNGPIHHLVAISVDGWGRPLKLFTVNQWVVGDDFIEPTRAHELLARFDVQMDKPSYLVNRWLSAIVRLYEVDIRTLIQERDATLERYAREQKLARHEVFNDRTLRITSQIRVDFQDTIVRLERLSEL